MTNAPPLLPGFIAASVWTKLYVLPSVVISLFNADIYPTVTLPANSSPNGFPIATAISPTLSSDETPNSAFERFVLSILITAKSVVSSPPTIFAS